MLTEKYIQDHVKYIDNLPPEFGKTLARLILEKAKEVILINPEADNISIPLNLQVSEAKATNCINIEVNGVHVGHIGV